MATDWTQVPSDLLQTIAGKLTIYIDYIRIRAVCTTWHFTLPSKPNHPLTQSLPWLMIPHIKSKKNFRSFFSLSENKIHLLDLPEARYKRCCGSSQGWLVLIQQHTPHILLLNPLTRTQIQLPPITSFPNVLEFNISKVGKEYLLQSSLNGDRYTRNIKEMCEAFIKKVILSSTPAGQGDYSAVGILNETGELAICRNGDTVWRLIEGGQFYCEDVVFCKGMLYGVNKKGELVFCNCDVGGDAGQAMVSTRIEPVSTIQGGDILYLVDSFEELLLVVRYLDLVSDVEDEVVYMTVKFEVFAFDGKEMDWVRMRSLGDRALFLGGNSSVCLLASDFRGCKGNCIYFTDDYTEGNGEGVRGDHDVGVFNLGDGSINPLPCYTGNVQLVWPPHIWVTPNTC